MSAISASESHWIIVLVSYLAHIVHALTVNTSLIMSFWMRWAYLHFCQYSRAGFH